MVLQSLLSTHIRFLIWKINHVKYQCKTPFTYPIFNNKIWSKIDWFVSVGIILIRYAGGGALSKGLHAHLYTCT